MIKEAFSKKMRKTGRKRIERRKKMNMLIRTLKNKCGYDSGELGSDSSLSSDEGKSVMSAVGYMKNDVQIKQRQKCDALRSTIRNSGLYNDCTDSLKNNSFRNTIQHIDNSDEHSTQNRHRVSEGDVNRSKSLTILKERFNKGFQLPVQRFQNSSTIWEKDYNKSFQKKNKLSANSNNFEGEDEQIFPNISYKNNYNEKSNLNENYSIPENKRTKIDSSNNNQLDEIAHIFKKPKMLEKSLKQSNGKGTVKEVLISKSNGPLNGISLRSSCQTSNLQNQSFTDDLVDTENHKENETSVSMKPSFMRRKLFTHKLDNLDKQNPIDLPSPSPNNKKVIGKNKTRKLVSSQSCLSRDPENDSNVMDLINKIVTPEEINSTVNKTNINYNNMLTNDDKLDVMSVISVCKSGAESDTFTDEEIFATQKTSHNEKTKEIRKINTECSVVIEKFSETNEAAAKKLDKPVVYFESQSNHNQRTVTDCVKNFWDTDLESDMETQGDPRWKTKVVSGQAPMKDAGNNTMKLHANNVKEIGEILTVRGSQNANRGTNKATDLDSANKENILVSDATNKPIRNIPSQVAASSKITTRSSSRNVISKINEYVE
ncbi:unnamed protein product, partial [Leptidea sinapis]